MRHSAWGPFIRATVGTLLLFLFRVRVVGKEKLPSGGAILSGNHVSHMDPVLLWCASPRHVHFMAKRELFEGWLLRFVLSRVWAFPVSRGEADRAAIATATELLRAGEFVGIFPEGTRAAEGAEALGEGQGGAAFLALRAGVPLVPIGIVGTERVLPRGKRVPRLVRVTISFGDPIDPATVAPEGGRKERVDALTATLMGRIRAELDRTRGLGR